MTTLVAGSYERFLFGLKCTTKVQEGAESLSLEKEFEYPAHKGPVKCLDTRGPFVATGGSDDTIHLYNLQTQTDLGFLMSPGDGAVTAVRFHAPATSSSNPSHLLSGAADGSISIWRAGGDWGCLKTMDGHKRAVTGLSIHPSGRLALSTSFDGTLRMWNLVKGKPQFKQKLPSPADDVAFGPAGDMYSLLCGRRLSVHSVEGSVPDVSLDFSSRQLCMTYESEQAIWAGTEDGTVLLWDPRSPTPALTLSGAHGGRVRGVTPLGTALSPASQTPTLVASAASDGTVCVWDTRMTGAHDGVTPLGETSTSARLTCLGVRGHDAVREAGVKPRGNSTEGTAKQPGKKRKRKGIEAAGGQTNADQVPSEDLRHRADKKAKQQHQQASDVQQTLAKNPNLAGPLQALKRKVPDASNGQARQKHGKLVGQNPGKSAAAPLGTTGRQNLAEEGITVQAHGAHVPAPADPMKGIVHDGVVDFMAGGAAGPKAGGLKRKKKNKARDRRDGGGGELNRGDPDMDYALMDPEFASWDKLVDRTRKKGKKGRPS